MHNVKIRLNDGKVLAMENLSDADLANIFSTPGFITYREASSPNTCVLFPDSQIEFVFVTSQALIEDQSSGGVVGTSPDQIIVDDLEEHDPVPFSSRRSEVFTDSQGRQWEFIEDSEGCVDVVINGFFAAGFHPKAGLNLYRFLNGTSVNLPLIGDRRLRLSSENPED